MADSINPTNNKSFSLLPRFYRSDTNKKFTQATVDQLVQPGIVKKVNGYIGRQNAKASTGGDIFVKAANDTRQNYQLEPGLVVKDELGNTTFFKDYIDYINQLEVFGSNVSNHAPINEQEFYSWNPHIDWDKFVNFQNYYWLPFGPDVVKIAGQQQAITSTYTVSLESELDSYEYVFTPNGLTRNPTLTLYKGQTYKFDINSPGQPFSIKTSRSQGSQDRYITIGLDGVAVENGIITFTVPKDAPDVLYYVSEEDINLGGVFQVKSIDENTKINVEEEILGKKNYTLANGTPLSNGMKVRFIGKVTPEKYEKGEYYVEGVGTAIVLIKESDLALLSSYTESESVLFDTTPFDSLPFSDATSLSKSLDYVVINRASPDRNPWSRYNRWFHKNVIEASAKVNNKIPEYDQNNRAVRPIIEFEAGLKLFNFGLQSPQDVDLIDTFTKDVFSTIEGSLGYNIDKIQLAQGQRILFTADTDPFVKNKIFRVDFIDVLHENTGSRQIHLVLESDPFANEVVVIKQGSENQGASYWYDGTKWIKGQQKTKINQPPLFDIVDNDAISFGDITVYDGSTFTGTKLFSYKEGSGSVDSNLGFPLSYKNINNIGDIVFNFDIITDTFRYKKVADVITQGTNIGYLVKISPENRLITYDNGWKVSTAKTTQAALRIYKNSNKTNNFDLDIFNDKNDLDDLVVRVYINGIRLDKSLWSLVAGPVYKKIVLNKDISTDDVLTIRAFAKQPINNNGHYEIPINLQNNPLNDSMSDFTLGEVIDHVNSIVDNLELFSGEYPGPSNLRDLGDITPYGTKFVQHSGPLGLSLYHITNQTNNIVKAVETARDQYNKFKRNFISVIETLGVHVTDNVAYVNLILQEINKDKPKNSPYYFSDMVGSGANTYNSYTVIDNRIKTYPLSETFNLDVLSNKAVYVYLNKNHLLYGVDYTFSDQGFIVLNDKVEFQEDDIIEIYEYENTDGCFIPQTPTKLGIWPKFEPKIYVDYSLVTPRTMIQGHDGSQILAYDDFRDELILELEKRIFNNIKVNYNSDIFDIYDILPSYTRSTPYSLEQFNEVLAPQFYKWTSLVDRDFTKPLSFDRTNPLTFNYRGHSAPDGREVPGYWRGIYRWMLDTDRPNICPWEMLGFTVEPSWWESVYGPAPYTSDNLVLWEDLSKGLVKEPGKPIIKLEKFVRPFLTKHIPVDQDGNLVGPIISGLADGLITQETGGDYIFGDVSPVEAAWRRSSHYPFGFLITALLLQPAKTFGVLLDRSRVVRNLTGQLVYSETGLRISPKDLVLPSIYSSETRVQTAGIINYLVDYILSDNLKSYSSYKYDLENICAQLSYRLASFTSKEKFNLLLDSKSPISTGSVFVPQEDYDIVLNVSSPVKKITYSGVIITKLQDGYEVKGYSKVQPYFKYYSWIQSGPTINVGGISESYSDWTAGQEYAPSKVITYNGKFYRVKSLHTTTNVFEPIYYQILPGLPVVGGRESVVRTKWDRKNPITVPYGTKIRTVQEVVDFLQGYGEYLKDNGFIFDDFNNNLNTITNWETSAKEFLFWTTQNWSSGQDKWDDWLPNTPTEYQAIVRYNGDYYQAIRKSPASEVFIEDDFIKLDGLSTVGSPVISLSPAAGKLTFSVPYTVVDNIKNPFYTYEIFKVDGTPLEPRFLNSYREDNAVSYTPEGEDAIYGATFYLVQKEQVVLLKNTTMFNDTIYNPPSGYRQERIKISGYTSTDWYGAFDSPGFIFDQADIQDWTAWEDYALGSIVKYKEFYYSAASFIPGTESFDSNSWIKLDDKPSSRLIPNWTYKAAQFEDFYSLDSDNFDVGQQKMAQHLIGYQKRQYLENIIKDDVSEFKFYQGMIIEKGTQNVLNKLFDVLSAEGQESLSFYEEWALRVGQYGTSSAFENIEFILDETLFKNNPQGFKLISSTDNTPLDFIIRQTPNDVYLKPLGYNNNPWPVVKNYLPYLRTPGYVRQNEVALVLKTIDEIVNYSVDKVNNGNYVWVGFKGREWDIYKYIPTNIKVLNAEYDSSAKEITLETRKLTNIEPGSYVGIENTLFNGFYKVKKSVLNKLILSASIDIWPTFEAGTNVEIFVLTSQRVSSIDQADTVAHDTIRAKDLLWTDDSGDGKWATWQYNPVYTSTQLKSFSPSEGLEFGRTVAINKPGTIAASSASTGEVFVYNKLTPGLPWSQKQALPRAFLSSSEYGPKWISSFNYVAGAVVFYINSYYRSLGSTQGDYPNSNPELWEKIYFSDVLAISNDGEWLAVGSPSASKVSTFYQGEWDNSTEYSELSVVNFDGKLYQSIVSNNINQSPDVINSLFWKLTKLIEVDVNGDNSSLVNQGAVALYKKDKNNFYNHVSSFVSPNPTAGEKFGSNLVFGDNTLIVGAIGNGGKIYQIDYAATVYATGLYNSLGSSGTTLKLTTTLGIEPGMEVIGTGFVSGQKVEETYVATATGSIAIESGFPILTITNVASGTLSPGDTVSGVGITTCTIIRQTLSNEVGGVLGLKGKYRLNISQTAPFGTTVKVNSTLLKLDLEPDSTPDGRLSFGYTSWGYKDLSGINNVGDQNYSYSMDISSDASTLTISSPADSKVYVYKNVEGVFDLIQTIEGNDIDFGHSLSLSDTGTYLAVSSPLFDDKMIDEGEVFVYKFNGTNYGTQPIQSLTNVNPETNGAFGSKISFMNDYESIVVYSTNADIYVPMTFDKDLTTFDDRLTEFTTRHPNNGRVDVYDLYSTKWVFSESLPTTNIKTDKYGKSITIGANHVFVGASNAVDRGETAGLIYEYSKLENRFTWKILHKEINKLDLTKIKSAFLYNKKTNKLITYIDVIDPVQGKIPGPAEQELKYKTFYDPATYSVGTSAVNVDDGMAWTKAQVGTLWWDLTNAKFVDSHDTDPVYRNSTWNTLFPGASIDVYEWVESKLKPADWDDQADTDTGIAQGISGTSLYGNDVYSVDTRYDNVSKSKKYTYYFWVKNKKTIPNVINRSLSAQDVADLIENPRGYGYKYLALTGTDSFSLINVKPLLEDKNVVLSVQYWIVDHKNQNVHSEWKIISNNKDTQLPSKIETKWFDSLCGKDSQGRLVPDPLLAPKLQYGIEDRPRQGMFANRFEALKQFFEKTNIILMDHQVVGQVDLSLLESYDPEPNINLGLYDAIFDTDLELRFANINKFKRALLEPVINNGKITGVNILFKGNGYINAPYVDVAGSGFNAKIKTVINSKGQVIGVDIVSQGYGYIDNTTLSVRPYTVLVHSDTQALNAWSLYAYDETALTWSRIRSQSYDTRKYWSYSDWYADGYNQYSTIDYSVSTFTDLNFIETNIGNIVKIKSTAAGGWILLKKYANSSSIDWTQSYEIIGNQNGTIQFSSSLYQFTDNSYGYDSSLYDGTIFDNSASIELRNILNCIKNNIFIDTRRQHYIDLFFISVRYALAEQNYLDWIFKTSFVKSQHNAGSLKQLVTYKNDNLADFESYISEVKPYRTKVREYVSAYSNVETSQLSTTDFDLQPIYRDNGLTVINTALLNGNILADDNAITTYPWKHWVDNVGFRVIELKLVDGGSGYHMEPDVKILGNATTPATARAFISNGKVNRIVLLTKGSGYLTAPTVIIDGGLLEGGVSAKAVAIIGDSVVRSNLIRMKFDRITQNYFITQLEETETFTGTGSRRQWPLTWAPDVRVGKSTVTINGVDVLRDDYKLIIVKSTTRGYTSYSGSIIFDNAVDADATIVVKYLKDWSLLNAADRIQYYYNPTTGQLGKDLSQLMTGVDYGGVVIDGIGFNINEGWDSAPYFSDKWDSFDSTFDDYIVTVDADTHEFTLPYVPADGEEINIYYVKLFKQLYISDGETLDYEYDPQYISNTTVVAELPIITVSQTVETSGSNLKGSFNLILTSTDGIEVGDLLSINLNGVLAYETIVSSITNSTTIKLNQILFDDIPAGTEIKFSRKLINKIDYTVNFIGYITLKEAVPIGNEILISSKIQPIRLDDPYYDLYDGITEMPNGRKTAPPGTIVNTVYGDGEEDTWTIPETFEVNDGDQFILRKSTSDGSIKPQETDYDTALTGGDLTYSSATGLLAEDIIVDGDGFATPTSSPATEEVVPGQIFDTVAIKIYDQPVGGSANIKVDHYVANGSQVDFPITQQPNSSTAILVKISNADESEILNMNDDYTINYDNRVITLAAELPEKVVVSIYSFGFNGDNVLDIDFFVGNGETLEFITRAPWLTQFTGLVYIDGLPTDAEFFETDETYVSNKRVGIRFPVAPNVDSIINFVIVAGPEQTFSITKTEKIATDGSLIYNLENKVGNSLPSESNIIVRVDQEILTSANNIYYTIKSNKLTYAVDSIAFKPYSIDVEDIVVLIGNKILALGKDYTVDLGAISIKLQKSTRDLYIGEQLVISIVPNRFTVGPSYAYISGTNNTNPRIMFNESYDETRVVEVISSYNHDILDIQRTNITVSIDSEITPGTIEYYNYVGVSGGNIRLDRAVVNDNYVWITKNKSLLVPSVDYVLNSDKQSIKLTIAPEIDDEITVMTYSNNILKPGISYMQFKDMLNRTHYKRLNRYKQTQLVNDLHYNDLSIEVEDAGSFDRPNPARNKPGIIEIRGERIEYFKVDGNTLSQLRRGTLGTGTPKVHKAGSFVQDIGTSETIPYNDTTIVEQITSDGSNIIPLKFIPTSIGVDQWFTDDGYTFVGEFQNTIVYNIKDVVSYNEKYYSNKKSYEIYDSFTVSYVDTTTNLITCSSTANLKVGRSVLFTDTISNISVGTPYYVASIDNINNKFRVSLEPNGSILQLEPEILLANNIGKGKEYTIYSIGNTDFTLIGASENIVGLTFTASWPGDEIPLPTNTTGEVSSTIVYNNVVARPVILPTDTTYWNHYDTTIPSGYGQSNDIEVFIGGYSLDSAWANGVEYSIGDIITIGSYTYRCVVNHTSTLAVVDGVSKTFYDDIDNWKFFVGNIRLKKKPYYVHNVNVHPESSEGDVRMDPDFTVDGTSKELRLTTPLSLGTKVTVVKRMPTGNLWDAEVNVQDSTDRVSEFIKAVPGIWYTSIGKYD